MKRTEVTVAKLKELGYVAKENWVDAWRFSNEEKPCSERHSAELFDLVVDAARNGKAVEITKNNRLHTVEATIPGCTTDWGGCGVHSVRYYLSRPMTEAEILEANLHTGVWEE